MKTARITALTGPDGIRIEEEPSPSPGPGQVALDMKALGLNRAELMFSRGEYLLQPKLPNRVGLEGAGVISALGEGVHNLAVGQRAGVLCAQDMLNFGAAAERVVVPASMLLPDVPRLTDVELAAFWVAYLTAYAGMVQQGALKSGETVLISAASSSVGLASIQLARQLGARPIATTRTLQKKARLLEAGAEEVLVTQDGALPELEGGIDLAFDAVGGSFINGLSERMNPGGRLVVYGVLSGEMETPFPLFPALFKGLRMSAFHLGYQVLGNDSHRASAIAQLQKAAPALKPTIDRRFEFPNLADAYRHMEGGQQFGKIAIDLR